MKFSEKKIHIGFFMYTPMVGGAELYLKNLLWHLDRNCFDVTLFFEPWEEFINFLDLSSCPKIRLQPVKIIEQGGHFGAVRSKLNTIQKKLPLWERFLMELQAFNHRLPLPMLKLPGKMFGVVLRYAFAPLNFFRLYRAFQAYPVDILHVINGGYPGAQSAQLAVIVAKLNGCRHCVMSVCATAVPRAFPRSLEKLLDWWVGKKLDRFIVPSMAVARCLIEYREFEDVKMEKIPYGVTRPEECLGNEAKILMERSPPGSGPISIGAVGGFLPRKGFHHLLEALALLKKQQVSFRGVLIGDGPVRILMERKATNLGLAQDVNFLGQMPFTEMLKSMGNFDIFVLSSELEGLPLVILHAMSLGRPIVSTDVAGVADVIEHERTGILVPAANPQALAQAIMAMIQNPGKAQAMGRMARKRYDEFYTLEHMVFAHVTLYQKAGDRYFLN